MRVKVGNTWYDPKEVPICIELNERDKLNIADMGDRSSKYSVFDDDKYTDNQLVFAWMDDKVELAI